LIDVEGKVVAADAVSGHPLIRSALANAARKAKFPYTNDVGRELFIKGIIIYRVKPDGTVETNLRQQKKKRKTS
jgi:hypothetical protein